jgi:membrane protease YdiL (CAAX protease family)
VTRISGWTSFGLLVALAGPPLFVLIPDRLSGGSPPALAVLLILQALFCMLAVLILWITLAREHLPLTSIGLRRPDRRTVATAVGLFIAVSLLSMLLAPIRAALDAEAPASSMERLAGLPVWFRAIIGLTGGIVEETLYRGYAIERLAAIVRSRRLAGAMSALVFALAHTPMWGLRFALAADLPFGVLMTACYLWRRDLAANILTHSAGLVLSLCLL